MNSWVELSWTSNPSYGHLTHYYNDMSFNKLKFIGKKVSITAPHSRSWYLSQSPRWTRGKIHREIIEALDESWSFAEFDNWDYNDEYDIDPGPDGKIDMIIFI
jgi:hypothetical protein